MAYKSLEECLLDLEQNGQLIRIKEEVDPYLEMAAIHLKIHEANGPALLFENVKGSAYKAASNIFSSVDIILTIKFNHLVNKGSYNYLIQNVLVKI